LDNVRKAGMKVCCGGIVGMGEDPDDRVEPHCIALILKKGTREIVASNRAGRELGAVPGKTCFQTCNSRHAGPVS
ncbi:MAG: hypothetical protein R6V55_05390, partial [Desulfovermiculus sp.]